MHTIIHRPQNQRFPAAKTTPDFRSPHYECVNLPQALKIEVYVPGVDATGVELTTRDTDLHLTARKAHLVRVNWQALHLEPVQRDYRLKLRLGAGYDFERLKAYVAKGVLTIVLPKLRSEQPTSTHNHRQVA